MFNDFKPRCLDKEDPKEFGHSAQGFLLPCCWMDRNFLRDLDGTHKDLFNDNLHLSNFDDIEEVLLTEEWQNFFKSLDSYDTAPQECKQKCSRNVTKVQI